jgi:hypothetical protein
MISREFCIVFAAVVVLALGSISFSASTPPSGASGAPAAAKSPIPAKPPVPLSRSSEEKLSPKQRQAVQALGAAPALFVENKGQWDAAIRYAVTGRAVNVALMDSALKFQLIKPRLESTDTKNPVQDGLTFSLAFEGAKTVAPKGVDEAVSKIRFYRGSDPSKWQSGVSTFKSAVYEGLYEGVDLRVYPRQAGVKYEFHLAAGTPVDRVIMKYDGVDGLSIDSTGLLHIKTSFGDLVDSAPTAWQETGGIRKDVKIRFRAAGEKAYGFEATGPVEASLPLTVDPAISWNGSERRSAPASASPLTASMARQAP